MTSLLEEKFHQLSLAQVFDADGDFSHRSAPQQRARLHRFTSIP